MSESMKIGELARRTGCQAETIRYYEREGLLRAPERTDGNYRLYHDAHVERLAFIRHCRALAVALAEVRRLLDFVAHPKADCGDINRLIDGQLGRVRARLKSMRALERQLAALRAQCQAGNSAADCGILYELVAAAHGEACACHGAGAEPGYRKGGRSR